MINTPISQLVDYGVKTGLVDMADVTYVTNRILTILQLSDYLPVEVTESRPLVDILAELLDYAIAQGLCEDDIVSRDLFDTALMGCITPAPSKVQRTFGKTFRKSPALATEWYYQFSQDCDYIRRDRIAKDVKWVTPTSYGDLDITINLSKPEKDPKAIAAAKSAPQSGYPKCMLCPENEGYAGRMNHPARQNLRLIPLTIDGQDWFLQYSPYVYYNEHCICLSAQHTPMAINTSTFRKLLDFVAQFPHYFVGSNADLPIVGGSILTHDHFQGGHYTFAMEKAPIEREVTFAGFEDVLAGIVQWPMSVLRLHCGSKHRLVELADKILTAWRGYTDADATIFAYSPRPSGTPLEEGGNSEPHNTITPIARHREGKYELDLVLRNNLTTEEYPMGLYHPHAELHHIKKENIGLIEVMGLAVLPARLKTEMAELATVLVAGGNPSDHEALVKHAPWAQEMKGRYTFTAENVNGILEEEIGKIFATVLEHAGVYKCTDEGREAFMKFVASVK